MNKPVRNTKLHPASGNAKFRKTVGQNQVDAERSNWHANGTDSEAESPSVPSGPVSGLNATSLSLTESEAGTGHS